MKFVLLLLLLCFIAPPVFSCNLLARFAQYDPQAMLNEQNQWYGMDVEHIKLLFKQAGCTIRFIELPWGRAIEMLKKGEIDIMTGMSITAERQQFAHFIGPQRLEKIVLASSAKAPITLEHLARFDTKGKAIAIQQGAYYGEQFSQIYAATPNPQSHFLVIPNNRMKLPLLIKGRISGLIEERLSLIHNLKHSKTKLPFKINLEVLHVNPVYFALSKRSVNPASLAKLRQAFKTLLKSNALNKITNKYDSL